jgi:hypothetical protein
MGAALHPPERWKLIEDIFHQCLQLPAESRAAFLDAHCGSDTELRKQIEALLDSASTPDMLQRTVEGGFLLSLLCVRSAVGAPSHRLRVPAVDGGGSATA